MKAVALSHEQVGGCHDRAVPTSLDVPHLEGGGLVRRFFTVADLALVMEASTDPLIPLIATVLKSADRAAVMDFIDGQHESLSGTDWGTPSPSQTPLPTTGSARSGCGPLIMAADIRFWRCSTNPHGAATHPVEAYRALRS